MNQLDLQYMRHALNIGRRGLGRVAPNPSVGCVIVRDGVVVGQGRTHEGGRPHAEAAALTQSGALAKGATAYVTLEPCAVHGRDAPCANALIEAGVRRAVIACHDLNPVVFKEGVRLLEDAGVEVSFGVMEDKARAMHRGFFLRFGENRPYVTLKCAVSSDGKIAAGVGMRTQISGVLASRMMHHTRSMHDAILIGSETFISDRPRLTTRLDGVVHDARRFIADRRGRIDEFMTRPNCDLNTDGFEILRQDDVPLMLSYLASKGITRLLVEGGAQLHRSYLEAGLVDEFQLCKSPVTLGGQGVDGVDLNDFPEMLLCRQRVLGEDVLEVYKRHDSGESQNSAF